MIGTLFDGEIARGRKVSIQLDEAGGMLSLFEDGVELVDWPLDEVRRIGDQAGRDNVVLRLTGQSEARLVVTDPDLLGRLVKLCPDLSKRERKPGQLGRAMKWAGAAVVAVAVIVLVIIPGLADRLAVFIPPEREEALGQHTVNNLRWGLAKSANRDVRFCGNPRGFAALIKLAKRLETDDELPYQIKLQVVDHPMPNAFAVPGGHVVVFDGLLKSAKSPQEVAAVIAHEFGHVIARDPTRLALRSASSAGIIGLLIGDFTGGAAVLLLTEQVVSASYTRAAEEEADAFAHETLLAAGISLEPMAELFDRMALDGPRRDGPIKSHLMSHPDLSKRAAAARAANALEGQPGDGILTAEEWQDLRQICATTLEEPVP